MAERQRTPCHQASESEMHRGYRAFNIGAKPIQLFRFRSPGGHRLYSIGLGLGLSSVGEIMRTIIFTRPAFFS